MQIQIFSLVFRTNMAHVFYTNFSTQNFSFTDFFKAVSSKTLQIKIAFIIDFCLYVKIEMWTNRVYIK